MTTARKSWLTWESMWLSSRKISTDQNHATLMPSSSQTQTMCRSLSGTLRWPRSHFSSVSLTLRTMTSLMPSKRDTTLVLMCALSLMTSALRTKEMTASICPTVESQLELMTLSSTICTISSWLWIRISFWRAHSTGLSRLELTTRRIYSWLTTPSTLKSIPRSSIGSGPNLTRTRSRDSKSMLPARSKAPTRRSRTTTTLRTTSRTRSQSQHLRVNLPLDSFSKAGEPRVYANQWDYSQYLSAFVRY